MIATQQIARQAAAVMDLYNEIDVLGYCASVCDVAAWTTTGGEWERRRLEARGKHYRDLQLEALERIDKS
jgi:hypothetical protein